MKTSNKARPAPTIPDFLARPGVSFEHERRQPNEVFTREDLEWAYERGARSLDEAASKITDDKRQEVEK